MIIVLLRTVILYLIALFVIRVMGKGELSKMDPFQMVVLFMIAELAAFPIEATEISIFTGVTALLTLLFLQVLFSCISRRNETFSTLISGRPCILIDKGVLNEKELKRLRISISDFAEQLRLKGFPSLADVEYAILEANGDLSVIPKSGKRPLTPEDMEISEPREDMPVTIIADGHLSRPGLDMAGMTEAALKEELEKRGLSGYEQVLFCFSDSQGALHVYGKDAVWADEESPSRKGREV